MVDAYLKLRRGGRESGGGCGGVRSGDGLHLGQQAIGLAVHGSPRSDRRGHPAEDRLRPPARSSTIASPSGRSGVSPARTTGSWPSWTRSSPSRPADCPCSSTPSPGVALPSEMRTGRVRAAVTAGSDAPPFLERLWRSTSSPTAELQLATQSGFEDACVRAHTHAQQARDVCLANVRCDAIPDAVIQDAVTAIVEPVVLSSLGHRWPKQTEAGEPVRIGPPQTASFRSRKA